MVKKLHKETNFCYNKIIMSQTSARHIRYCRTFLEKSIAHLWRGTLGYLILT